MKRLYIHVKVYKKTNQKTPTNKECVILKFDLYPVIGQIFRDLSLEIISNAIFWVEKQVSYNSLTL